HSHGLVRLDARRRYLVRHPSGARHPGRHRLPAARRRRRAHRAFRRRAARRHDRPPARGHRGPQDRRGSGGVVMELWVLFGTFFGLLLLGTPVAFCLGIASLATVLYMDMPPFIVFQRLNSGINAFALMAIPFFVYAGDLMVRGGIAGKLVRLAAALVGHLRGGLGQVNIVASTLFGGVSGSAVADASAVGGLMIPQMRERGYAADYGV